MWRQRRFGNEVARQPRGRRRRPAPGSRRRRDTPDLPSDVILCETIRRFKGLERPVIVLVELRADDDAAGPAALRRGVAGAAAPGRHRFAGRAGAPAMTSRRAPARSAGLRRPGRSPRGPSRPRRAPSSGVEMAVDLRRTRAKPSTPSQAAPARPSGVGDRRSACIGSASWSMSSSSMRRSTLGVRDGLERSSRVLARVERDCVDRVRQPIGPAHRAPRSAVAHSVAEPTRADRNVAGRRHELAARDHGAVPSPRRLQAPVAALRVRSGTTASMRVWRDSGDRVALAPTSGERRGRWQRSTKIDASVMARDAVRSSGRGDVPHRDGSAARPLERWRRPRAAAERHDSLGALPRPMVDR